MGAVHKIVGSVITFVGENVEFVDQWIATPSAMNHSFCWRAPPHRERIHYAAGQAWNASARASGFANHYRGVVTEQSNPKHSFLDHERGTNWEAPQANDLHHSTKACPRHQRKLFVEWASCVQDLRRNKGAQKKTERMISIRKSRFRFTRNSNYFDDSPFRSGKQLMFQR